MCHGRVRTAIRAQKSGGQAGTLKLRKGAEAQKADGGSLFGSVTKRIGSLSTGASKVLPLRGGKDPRTVFVAGATGRTGIRIVRELLAAGFKVRAGARDVEAAEESAALAARMGLLDQGSLGRLSFVEFDLEDTDGLAAAIGNAGKVVCTVGAGEGLDASAPKRIDGDGTIALVEAAAASGVGQFILVSSIGTGKFGLPAGVLNLFWGVLLWKRKAEEVLERSGMSYTIVRPGGMERPTDTYKRTHGVVLKPRDSLFGGQVSRLQVAELVAACASSPVLAENKCLEVVAEEGVAVTDLEDLLRAIPSEISREQQEEAQAAVAGARKGLADALEAVEAAQARFDAISSKVADLEADLSAAKADEKEVRSEAAAVIKEGREAQQALDRAEARTQAAARNEAAAKAVFEAARKAGASGEVLTPQQIRAIAQDVLKPREQASPSPRPQSPFGLFAPKQVAQEAEEAGPGPVRPASPIAALFGGTGKVKAAAPTEEDEEEEEPVVVARPTSPFAALFGGAQKQQVEEEEEEEEEEAPAPEPVRATSPFAALFGPKAAAPPAAAKPAPATPAPAAARVAAPPAPAVAWPAAAPKPAGLFGGLFGGGQSIQIEEGSKISVPPPPSDEPAKPKPAPAAPKAAAPKVAAPAPAPGPAAPKAAAPAPAPTPAPAAPKAAAPAPAPAAPKAAVPAPAAPKAAAPAPAPVPAPAPERDAARKAALEEAKRAAKEQLVAAAAKERASQENAEQDALARIKAEREGEARKKAEAKAKAEAEALAKAKAEKEAKVKAEAERLRALNAAGEEARKAAEEAAKAKAEEAAKAKAAAAAAATAAAEATKQKAEEAAKAKAAATAAAAPKPAAAPAAAAEEPSNVAEARDWVESWKAKQQQAPAAAPAPAAPAVAPSAAAAAAAKSDEAPNVAEARKWVQAWKAKQAGAGAVAPAAAAAAAAGPADEDAVVVEESNPFDLGKLFGMFGAKK